MRSLWPYLVVIVLTAGITYVIAQFTQPRPAPDKAASRPDERQPDKAQPAAPAAAPASPPADVSPEEETNIQVYQKVNRSVVNITTRSVQADDFLSMLTPREGSGSGSVLDKQGHILTNFHVVEGAGRIAVTLFDGSSYEAKPLGPDPASEAPLLSDANNDLAVLKIDAPADKLYPITWGDSNKLVVGMRVFAIGNPFGLERTLTVGIVSSLNRSLKSENNRMIRGIIQTDAAINPGNSGGPLLNRHGEMVGITTAIVSRAGQSSGIGLAVPATMAHRVVEELVRNGRVVRSDSGIFSVYELDKGLLVARLAPDGPAERAGLRGPKEVIVRRFGVPYRTLDRAKADLIVAVDGQPVRTLDELLTHVEARKPGEKVLLSIIREGEKMDVAVELGETRN